MPGQRHCILFRTPGLVTLGVSQSYGYPFGVPIIRTIVYGVYIGVPPFWEATIMVLDS